MNALCVPELRDCRRVFLRGYETAMAIGWHEHEKRAPQRVRVDVDLFVPLAASTPRNDDLAEVLDYEMIRDTVQRCSGSAHVRLQETLVDRIAAALLAHAQVRAVRVACEKPDAYSDCDAIGVEVFRIKPS